MVAINGVESDRFQGFLLVLTGNVLDQVTTVRCVNFFWSSQASCLASGELNHSKIANETAQQKHSPGRDRRCSQDCR
jgi:hypothetical protein